MEPTLHYRQARQIQEMEDLVATFVENELGRHDWANNWPVWKTNNPNFLDKIKKYFHQLGEEVNPAEIARHLDQMVLKRPGRWR